jgi:peptide/nickel transport system permease protein
VDEIEGLARLVLQRLAATVPVLLLVTAGVFALLHLTPGDPIDAMMAESVDATAKETLRRELGLDRPIPVQYAAWMGRLLRGDLGRSIRTGEPVIENVGHRIRPSLELTLLAMTVSLLIAFPVAIASAIRHNRGVDRLGTTFALFGICMPNFLLALLLIFVFGVTLRWLPISGYTDPLEEPLDGLRSLALPAITLGLALAAVVTRTLRSSLLETLGEDYVRTARAKGLSEGTVIRAHVLKNALIPVVTVLGLQLGTLIGGAVITEYVFALPGVGRLVVDAVFARDYPLVQGVVLLIALAFIASNLVVDVLYGWIDPRIRYR